jgi:hypothetical protein
MSSCQWLIRYLETRARRIRIRLEAHRYESTVRYQEIWIGAHNSLEAQEGRAVESSRSSAFRRYGFAVHRQGLFITASRRVTTTPRWRLLARLDLHDFSQALGLGLFNTLLDFWRGDWRKEYSFQRCPHNERGKVRGIVKDRAGGKQRLPNDELVDAQIGGGWRLGLVVCLRLEGRDQLVYRKRV